MKACIQTPHKIIVELGINTAIKEVLQMMKRDKHTYPATIELEHNTPPGSTVMAELPRCVQYARDSPA